MKRSLNIGILRGVIIALIAVIAVIVLTSSNLFYIMARVEQQEVGIQFRGGRIVNVVGPGLYSDFGLYVELKKVPSSAVPFTVQDDEIITKDKQRLGIVVSGDIFRPNLAQADILKNNWAQYSELYLREQILKDRVENLARQAAKVCIGERTFNDNVIGTARDVLRECIDEELSQLAQNYGLQIANVVVPNVILSPEVQALLDAITQSRLNTEKAAQDKLKAEAEAAAEQARQQGEVRVAQSRVQEEARQQTILAQLEKERAEAQRAVIEATKSNELLAAERDFAIAQAQAKAAAEKAKADLALEIAKAQLYADNPAYLTLQTALANASALKPTDKIIFTPVGTTPTIIVPGPGVVPTVNTQPGQ
ncbi:MAG: SPFH domain-containing protein [Anaerolineae bacterium]|nr:SPFH domain-containing protein [Anaerolineae bacterium]